MARKPINYVNNKQMYEVMKEYILAYEEAMAAEAGEDEKPDLPQIPTYIAECLIKMADGAGKRPNFSGYTYLDEMKADALFDCMRYLHNFDFRKYDSPFSYFNRIIWFAFLRRIEKEKKQQLIRYKNSERLGMIHSKEVEETMGMMAEKYDKK